MYSTGCLLMGRTTQIVSMLKLETPAKRYWFCELVYYIFPKFYVILYININTNNVPMGANICPISNACTAIPCIGFKKIGCEKNHKVSKRVVFG